MNPPNRGLPALLSFSLCSLLIYLYLQRLGNWQTHILPFLAAAASLSVVYFILVRLTLANPQWQAHWKWIVLFSIFFRVPLLFTPVSLTTDIHRYVWDGKIQTLRVNPYQCAPRDVALKKHRDGAYRQMEFRNCPTVYPPGAQMLFHAVSRFFPDPYIGFKCVFFFFELLTMALLLLLLKQMAVPLSRILIYGYNPLVVLEITGSNHLDGVFVCLVVLAVLLLVSRKKPLGLLMLGASTLVKWMSLAFAPLITIFLYRTDAGKGPAAKIRNTGLLMLLFGSIVTLGYAAYYQKGVNPFLGLREFETWESMDFTLFYFIRGAVGQFDAARWVAMGIAAICLIYHSTTQRGDMDLLPGLLAATGLVLFLNPIIRPWYYVWTVPFLCVSPRRSWVLLSCAILGTYVLFYSRDLLPPVKMYVYGVFYMLWLAETIPAFISGVRRARE